MFTSVMTFAGDIEIPEDISVLAFRFRFYWLGSVWNDEHSFDFHIFSGGTEMITNKHGYSYIDFSKSEANVTKFVIAIYP